MNKPASIVLLLSLSLATACATGIALTGEGQAVQHVPRTDIPVGCNLLGDIAIGIPPDAARPRTEEQLVILMRNKAAEHGGTHVIIESKSEQTGASGRSYWSGRGIAYDCPEEQAAAAPSEQTAGAEAPAEEEEPTGGEDSSAVEEDPIVDDLLGD